MKYYQENIPLPFRIRLIGKRLWKVAILLGIGSTFLRGELVNRNLVEAAQPSASEETEAIVSEKDSVALVQDASVQEAMQRRPDLSFANVTIDGEESDVSLDSIPADAVESVEVMKAVTPDLDADARGGSVSLKTKPAYQQETVSSKGSIELIHASMYSHTGYDTSYTRGGPLNRDKTWGGRLNLRWQDYTHGNENNSQDWKTIERDGEKLFVLKNSGYNVYRQNLSKKEIGASLDWKASDKWAFFGRATYSKGGNDTIIPGLQYRFDKGEYADIQSGRVLVEGAQVRRGNVAWLGEEDKIEAVLGGNYENEILELDFKYTYQNSDYVEPDFVIVDFVQKDVDLVYAIEEPAYPVTIAADGRDLRRKAAFPLEDYQTEVWVNNGGDEIGAANLKWKGFLGNEQSFLKLGVKNRIRYKERISDAVIYDRYHGEYHVGHVAYPFGFADHSQGRYVLDAVPDYAALKSFFEDNADAFVANEKRTRERSDPNTFFVEEKVDAYYAMFNWERGKWRSILGWRIEETAVSFAANEVLIGKDASGDDAYIGTNPRRGESSYRNEFANAHFRYRLTDSITLIGSFTNTIKRPDFGDVAPFRSVDLDDREIEEGNPELKPTLFTNWDVSLDWKLAKNGLLSFEVFDRAIDDFIFERKSLVIGGAYDGFELSREENSASAVHRGLKATWRQPLAFFGIKDGLSLNINYTLQESEIEYPKRLGEVLPLTKMPDSVVKLALSYEGERLFIQSKYSRESLEIQSVAGHPDEDRFGKPVFKLDLSISYKIRKKIRLYADWENVTSESPFETYEGDQSRPIGYRLTPWILKTGMKFEL